MIHSRTFRLRFLFALLRIAIIINCVIIAVILIAPSSRIVVFFYTAPNLSFIIKSVLLRISHSSCLTQLDPLTTPNSSESTYGKQNIKSQWTKLFEPAYRQCILDGMSCNDADSAWIGADFVIDDCTKKCDMERRYPLIGIRNTDETKYFLDFRPNIEADEECNVITLGIGTDIEAERELAQRIPPTCHFHGADPGVAFNRDLYSQIGTFYPYAVAATGGLQTASLRLGEYRLAYKSFDIPHMDLITFLTKHAKVKIIDYLFMDIESAEIDMTPMFLPNGAIDLNGITVCQWSCEFHPGSTERNRNFIEFMRQNAMSGWYLPLHFAFMGNIRATFINVQHEICRKRYLHRLPK